MRAQIAMEYIMIIGFVLVILSGALYLFQGYARSSKDQLTESQIDVIATDMLNTAKEMYYLGLGNKKVITVDMPNSIKNMGVISSPTEAYIYFEVYSEEGTKQFTFQSDVGIKCYNTTANPTCGDLEDYVCPAGFGCEQYPDKDFSPGLKNFRIETVNCDSKYCIEIDEVSDELS